MDNRLRARRILVIVGIGTFLISTELLVFRSLNHFLDGFDLGMRTLVQRATVVVEVVSASSKLTPHAALMAIPSASPKDQTAYAAARLYELYSWPESTGIWNFCLLPSPSGVNIPVKVIFDKKLRLIGVDQLERKVSQLPDGARVIWMNGITSGETPTPESRKLSLPPTQTVEQVKRYAKAHGVQVDVPRPSPD